MDNEQIQRNLIQFYNVRRQDNMYIIKEKYYFLLKTFIQTIKLLFVKKVLSSNFKLIRLAGYILNYDISNKLQQRIKSIIVVRRLTTEILSEKCVVSRFRRCANVIECTYTNLDSIAYCTSRLCGIAYCCQATNLYSMLLY